jgi:hypothetical protein
MEKILEKIAEAVASKITGIPNDESEASYPFTGRWLVGFPDDTFVENCAITENKPFMSLYAGSQKYVRNWGLVKQVLDKSITEVVHEGGSTLQFELTGTHRGNNDYVLKIVQGGDPGTATYRLSTDGGETFGDETTVPAGGEIDIGDGTILAFSGTGQFVSGDTYSWKTISLMKYTYRSHVYSGTVNIELLAFTEKELCGDEEAGFTGYMDQLVELFADKAGINNNGYPIRASILALPTVIKDIRVNKYWGTMVLEVEGELYVEKSVPLVGAVEVQYENE